MKTALSVLAMAAASTALPASYVEMNEGLLWANFKQTYGKQYSGADESARRAIFKQNMLKAAEREAGSKTGVRHGMNAFTDLTAEEFKAYHTLSVPAKESPKKQFSESEVLKVKATSVDWRTQNRVTHVKNQAQCGSCWSFSATGGIEGQWSKDNTLTSVSEQELVSCDKVDAGCNGGLMDNAFQWLLDNHNGDIVTEEAYPYTSGGGITGSCKYESSMKVGSTISSYKDLAHDEDEMATWLIANGPISIAVDATSWQTYQGGVMDNCKSSYLDHGVLAVGVTPDYWIVKNSWASGWGESGYIRLARGTNQCLLKNSPSHPIV